ncbi:MAG: DMT family transporter [Phormidesmis sp.]
MVTTPCASALAWGCLAAFTWGLTGSFIKLLPGFSTVEVLAVRILLAFAVTLPIFLVQPGLLSASLALVRRPVGILLSSLMVFYYLFAVRAFQLAPVSDVTLMVGLSPILGLAFKLLTRKALVRSEIVGALTAFAGLLLFVLPKLQGAAGDRKTYLTGLCFAALAACVSLGYAALFKHCAASISLSPIAVSCTTFAIGSVAIAPITLLSSPALLSKLAQPHALTIALSLGIVSTVVPTFCYSYAAKHLPPVLTTGLNLLVPIFAALLAFFLLGETLPGLSMVGAVLVLVGIMVLSTARPGASLER